MSSILKVDTLQENTSANGITVDGLNIKDSKLVTADSVITSNITNDAVTIDKLNLISTSSAPSLEAKGDGSSQDGYIQLNCSQNSHGIKLMQMVHQSLLILKLLNKKQKHKIELIKKHLANKN